MKNYRWTNHFGKDFIVKHASCIRDAVILAFAERITDGKNLDCDKITKWENGKVVDEIKGKFGLKTTC